MNTMPESIQVWIQNKKNYKSEFDPTLNFIEKYKLSEATWTKRNKRVSALPLSGFNRILGFQMILRIQSMGLKSSVCTGFHWFRRERRRVVGSESLTGSGKMMVRGWRFQRVLVLRIGFDGVWWEKSVSVFKKQGNELWKRMGGRERKEERAFEERE